MHLDSGMGGIKERDVPINTKATEKIAAARHCNGVDWWIVTAEAGTDRVLAWLLDSTGLHEPVISETGRANTGIRLAIVGELSISPKGKWLAFGNVTNYVIVPPDNSIPLNNAFFQLCRFNNASGMVSDPITVLDSLNLYKLHNIS